jgi:hydrogenase-4 component B
VSTLLLVGLAAYSLAALLGAGRAGRASTAVALAGAAALVALGVGALRGATLALHVPLGPAPFALRLGLAPLGALFVLLVNGVGALALVYGAPYTRHLEAGKRRWVHTFTPLFLAAMSLVPLAGNLAAFLLAWEAMSLTSYALVVTDMERPGVVRSGFVYLVMTHTGAICLVAAFLLLTAATGSMDFAVWAHLAPGLGAGLRSLVFLLLLLGFGSKAALVPLHVWLPRAHPVAPSHISGLMSGVMLKVALYGFIFFALRVLGPGPLWWGLLLLGLGALSAVLGVLYALMEHDLKRLLAYHSVENVGIIALGLGVALCALHAGWEALAALALVAALYHTVNHALFKTALFFDAGSIQHAGAGRNLDALGGLVQRLPWTAASTLVAAAAIAGLPPLNGFVSEWLTYQSLLRLAARGGHGLALSGFAGVLALALTGALAAACFLKVTGVALLARPRSERAERAREVPAGMWASAGVLAALCVAAGLLPGLLAVPLTAVATALVAARATAPTAARALVTLALPWQPSAHLAPLILAAAAAALGLLAAAAGRAGHRARAAATVAAPWACGGVLGLRSQYSATAYAKPLRQVFRRVYLPQRAVHVESTVDPFFRTRVTYDGHITPVFDRYLYAPLLQALLALARAGRRLQSGSLRLYLGYVLVALVLLLALVH